MCMQTNQTQPFTYIVGWTTQNIYYVGVRYAKGCSPEDLGTTYFTSSKVIKPLWAKEEPDFKCIYPFETREEALAFEETLQREFDVLKSKQFANKQIRGRLFKNPGHSQVISVEQRIKISVALKGRRHTEESKKKMSLAKKGKAHSPEHNAKVSASQKGKQGKSHTLESREKISKARKEYWANKKKQQ